MRRTIGAFLAVLGVICLAGAVIIWAWIAPHLVRLQTDTDVKTVATGKGSGLDLATGTPFRDIDLKANRHLTSDEPDDDTVIWTMKVKLTTPTGSALTQYTDRVAVDRDNARAVNDTKYGEKIEDAKLGTRQVKHKGLTYHFPFHTKKTGYAIFEPNTGKAFRAEYDGKEKIDDLTVYKFTQNIPATKLRQTQVPGAALGSQSRTVPADLFYTNTRTFWVEPVSGWIVKASENAKTTLRAPGSDKDTVVVLANTLTFNDETVDNLADRAETDRDKINWLEKYVPVLALVAGILLLIIGLVLILLKRKPQDDVAKPVTEPTEDAAAESKTAESDEATEADAAAESGDAPTEGKTAV